MTLIPPKKRNPDETFFCDYCQEDVQLWRYDPIEKKDTICYFSATHEYNSLKQCINCLRKNYKKVFPEDGESDGHSD